MWPSTRVSLLHRVVITGQQLEQMTATGKSAPRWAENYDRLAVIRAGPRRLDFIMGLEIRSTNSYERTNIIAHQLHLRPGDYFTGKLFEFSFLGNIVL